MSIYDPLSVLASRTTSAFPLSIGTSFAFESLFEGPNETYDPNREMPPKIKIEEYSIMLINVSTLVRNIIGAIPTNEAESLIPKAIIYTLTEEINMIIDILTNEGKGLIKPYFYVRNYDKIEKSFHKAKTVQFYKAHTKKQLLLYNQIHGTTSLLKKMKEYDYVHYVDNKLIDKNSQRALIITHIPYDLLSYDLFNKLDLIESHTGILKTRKDYYTKFYDAKKLELSNIPFQRKMLAFFGDHVMFKPTHINIRKEIMNVAKKCHWSAITSESKVSSDLQAYMADIGIKVEYSLM